MNKPISAGDSPKAVPKAGIRIYIPIGTISLAKWPREKAVSRWEKALSRWRKAVLLRFAPQDRAFSAVLGSVL